MKNKLEQLYEEIIRKQDEYIKELEDKLKTPSDTEKLEAVKPDYEELRREVLSLNDKLSILIDENNALRWSLTAAHEKMNGWKNRSDMWEEDYYEEHRRAEKLYDELERLKNE